MSNRWSLFKEYKMRTIVLWAIIIANILLFLIGILVLKMLPENAGKPISDVIKYSLKLIVDSGGFMDDAISTPSVILTVILVVFGMIAFTGGIIAYIQSVVTNLIYDANRGGNKLKLGKHIVIINWNNKIPLLVTDFLRARKNTYVVIMTDKKKEFVLSEIDKVERREKKNDRNQGYRMKRTRKVIVREFVSFTEKDLDDLCVCDASSVLLMSPDERFANRNDCDLYVIKQFMQIVTYFANTLDIIGKSEAGKFEWNTGVAVEIQSPDNISRITDYPIPYYDNKKILNVAVVNSDEVIGKIIAMTVLRPALHDAISELLTFKGSEIYVLDKALEGFESDFVTDMKRREYSIPLFDHETYRVYLSKQDDNLFLSGEFELNTVKHHIDYPQEYKGLNYSILIIGKNNKLPFIIEELEKFKDKGVSVELFDLSKGLSDKELIKAFSASTDVIILSDDSEAGLYDEIPLLVWNCAMRNDVKDVNFYVEVLNPENREIMKMENTSGNIFISNRYVSGMFTQLGSDMRKQDSLISLLTPKSGCNLWCYPASLLFSTDKPQKFSSKQELVVEMFVGSDEKLIPIGVIRNGISYLFTTDEGGVTDTDLFSYIGDDEFIEGHGTLTIMPTDEIIVVERAKN